MSSFAEKAEASIPAEIRMISGCRDEQTSADVSNVASFTLPDPAGRAGGACTSALLNIMYKDKHAPDDDISFQDVLLKMRDILSSKNFTQIPQLSSSRPMDISTKFDISQPDFHGNKRAVMVGINYIGQDGELRGCHNDVLNMKEYLMDVHGFEESNMNILLDDGVHTDPTKDNIMTAFREIVQQSEEGDVVYIHYSGHGASVRDDDGDEADGMDETLVPVDYNKSGLIRDDDLLTTLVVPMKKGVFVTAIMDCCHSGTILDLPFNFKADGEMDHMVADENYDFDPLTAIIGQLAAGNPMLATAMNVVDQGCGNCTIS
ncbi:metacaspase [Chaetoceros tenuissimus]|uniref:Metacaspase n=1 Tax=Chaetoceros tenuissimus TaxID=426638 RepID=A0AAD3HBI7_9STRA|nr:metacaspase [Chaetoceros tenuissimus]